MEPFENHFAGGGAQSDRTIGLTPSASVLSSKPWTCSIACVSTLRRIGVGKLQIAAHLEPFDDLLEIRSREILSKNHLDGLPDQVAGNRVRTLQFAFILQLDFSGDRRIAE